MFVFCHLTLSPLPFSSPVTVVGRTVGFDRIVHLVLHRRGRVRHPQRLHSRGISRPRAKLLVPTHHLSQVCGAYDGLAVFSLLSNLPILSYQPTLPYL